MSKLVLQILGETDISVDSQHGKEMLKEPTLEDVQEVAKLNENELIEDLERVDFPLIREIHEQQQNNDDLYFGIILTDQRPWLKALENELSRDAWMEYIASDGIWWKNILNVWCQNQGINWFPIHLTIHQEGKDEDNGVADWEKMAHLVKTKFHNLIDFQQEKIHVRSSENNTIEIDQLIIQHSSGTPALSGALYLWGIEQKLDKQNVEFAYLSRENTSPFHSGDQWQWRFKAPQIKQLLDIQDFAGAKILLKDYFSRSLIKKVNALDNAVSLNLSDLSDIADETAKGKVIERIAIALWSEKAFRENGQWMHWYLRVAGAFELAIRHLVKKQAPNKYDWEKIDPGTLNTNKKQSQKNPPSILIYEYDNQKWEFKLGMAPTVDNLLGRGKEQESQGGMKIPHEIPPIKDKNWAEFTMFYCRNGWHLSNNFQTGFTTVRNQLYHLLQGDQIDQCLDKKTENLGSVTHAEHPAEIAVQYLHYVNQLAGIDQSVQNRVKHYQSKVQEVKANL
ncbi:MAG: hypothetical protein ABEJ25_03145 [Candidatus Bipolaricaulia bacterium]